MVMPTLENRPKRRFSSCAVSGWLRRVLRDRRRIVRRQADDLGQGRSDHAHGHRPLSARTFSRKLHLHNSQSSRPRSARANLRVCIGRNPSCQGHIPKPRLQEGDAARPSTRRSLAALSRGPFPRRTTDTPRLRRTCVGISRVPTSPLKRKRPRGHFPRRRLPERRFMPGSILRSATSSCVSPAPHE